MTTSRRSGAPLLALAIPVSLVALSTPPAHAGGVDPCNRTYEPIASAPLTTSTGETVGQMRLLHKPGTKQFCGRFHVHRGLDVATNKVRLKLAVFNADEHSGYAHGQSPASQIDPIVIDAHGYPAGSTVSYVVVFKGAERTTGEVTAVVP